MTSTERKLDVERKLEVEKVGAVPPALNADRRVSLRGDAAQIIPVVQNSSFTMSEHTNSSAAAETSGGAAAETSGGAAAESSGSAAAKSSGGAAAESSGGAAAIGNRQVQECAVGLHWTETPGDSEC